MQCVVQNILQCRNTSHKFWLTIQMGNFEAVNKTWTEQMCLVTNFLFKWRASRRLP